MNKTDNEHDTRKEKHSMRNILLIVCCIAVIAGLAGCATPGDSGSRSYRSSGGSCH